MFDYDHKDNNRSNNSPENCNPISLYAHRIKTKNPKYYNDLIKNKHDSLKKFRLKMVIDLINGIKKYNMLDSESKNKLSEIIHSSI